MSGRREQGEGYVGWAGGFVLYICNFGFDGGAVGGGDLGVLARADMGGGGEIGCRGVAGFKLGGFRDFVLGNARGEDPPGPESEDDDC